MQQRLKVLATKPRLVMLTAYDYTTARACEAAGMDLILVGDSLAMVFQGREDTKSITLEEMLYHCRAVSNGARNTPIVGDMPINTYDTPAAAVANARRFLEAGAHAVKVEGNRPEVIAALLESDIPVMGHIGLLPQTAERFSVQGRDRESALRLRADAAELDDLGVFAMVLECIPRELAREITSATRCRTIGIGAGAHCDGQVLVISDLLGLYDRLQPRFVRRYDDLGAKMIAALERYKRDVESGDFPVPAESYS